MPVPSAQMDASFQIVDARRAAANFSGKPIRNRQDRRALVTQEREKEKLHRSTSEIPLPVALLLIRLVCFQAR